MSDPKEQQEERDELDLDAETVKDLEPSQDDADQVRGGGKTYLCSGSVGV